MHPFKHGMRYAFVTVTAGVAVALGLITQSIVSIVLTSLLARVSGLLIAGLFVGAVLEIVWSHRQN